MPASFRCCDVGAADSDNNQKNWLNFTRLSTIEGISRPSKPARRPNVLTPQEIDLVFAQMAGVYGLIARLLYGTGMRLMECAQLRVKDVDFQRREIVVREGKGGKVRITMLPLSLVLPLREQISQAKKRYDEDRLQQRNGVMLPGALERKYPAAGTQWGGSGYFRPITNQPIRVVVSCDVTIFTNRRFNAQSSAR